MNRLDRYKTYDGCGTRIATRIIIIAAIIMLASCKTRTAVITVPEVRTDTTYITKTQRDSIYLHDSIYVSEKQMGDTILLTTTKWLTKYVERQVRDTLYYATHDTITEVYPVEVVKEVPKQLSWWQRARLALGNLMLILIAASVLYAAWKIYRKIYII